MSLSVDVEKHLGGFHLQVAFEVADPHEMLALLGPSGCGKSLTLRCIAGLVRPDRGTIVLNDRVLFDSDKGICLPPRDRRVGYLFQSYALFPTMTVEENVCAGILGGTRQERAARAAGQIRALRLTGLERRYPSQLSGGQRQRVAMARMLAGTPDLVLLDEPFSALDGYLRWQLELELGDLLRDYPGGAILVSHDRDEVYRLCDTVCVISNGHSEPKQAVRDLFAQPRTVAAALISGCKNFSAAHVVGPGLLSCDDWGVTLRTTLPVPADVTTVGVRAHYLEPASPDAPNALTVSVDRVIDSTFSTIVMVETPGGGLIRYELEKGAWARMGQPHAFTLAVPAGCVMPLAGDPGLVGATGRDGATATAPSRKEAPAGASSLQGGAL